MGRLNGSPLYNYIKIGKIILHSPIALKKSALLEIFYLTSQEKIVIFNDK